MTSPTTLPVDADWPLLVAFIAHRIGKRELAKEVGSSVATIDYYLTGSISQPKFDTGVSFLESSVGRVKPFELLQAIGMQSVPLLPSHVDWPSVPHIIRNTFGEGEYITRELSAEEMASYNVAVRNYSTDLARPLWNNAAILLNLLQDRLSAANYRELAHIKT